MPEQNSFGSMEGPVKALVRMCGKAAVEETFTMSSLNPEQQLALAEICSNPKHPWMIEHSQRSDVFDQERSVFEKELMEERQNELADAERKDQRKKRLILKTKKIFWNKKNALQKFLWILPRLIFWSILVLPIAYALIGVTVELLFNYTINLF